MSEENQQQAETNEDLLEELNALDVLEADELQEGVAFHAFRFAM